MQRTGAVAGLGFLNGCAKRVAVPLAAAGAAPTLPFYDMPGAIVPIRADLDRIFRITVCLRPFRAAGPRFDVEKVGNKTIVMNYGHGGSGWSLSWGSADLAVRKAMEAAPGQRDIAIIGAGALGLTAALTAQRMGYSVTIYAKERPPYVRSARATGSWTPDSRVALTGAAPRHSRQTGKPWRAPASACTRATWVRRVRPSSGRIATACRMTIRRRGLVRRGRMRQGK
ncbi:MAG: FAD-dependent oxidoreductase [Janthinobacterium lividum]